MSTESSISESTEVTSTKMPESTDTIQMESTNETEVMESQPETILKLENFSESEPKSEIIAETEPHTDLSKASSDRSKPVTTQPPETIPLIETQVEEPPAQQVGTMVWQSATGSKYHSINNCGRMNPNKATQITLDEALSRGLERCSKCW